MTKLLKAYAQTERKFKSDKVYKQYDDHMKWSEAYNDAQIKILKKMNTAELTYLLAKTQGMKRVLIKKYLDEAQERETCHVHEKKSKKEFVITIAS